MVVSLQYGLACRNQEVWGLRWECFEDDKATIQEVVSWGKLLFSGKTEDSTDRVCQAPSLLLEDLDAWKTLLEESGFRTRPEDFIISGDLGGEEWGVRDPKTGACHLSANQCRKWPQKFFQPAVKLVANAEENGYPAIDGATQYALRRGGISLRLRYEDAQSVAEMCGTSLQMLDRHYAFMIEELRGQPVRPADIEWRAARKEVLGQLAEKSRHLRALAVAAH
jgi:integrase